MTIGDGLFWAKVIDIAAGSVFIVAICAIVLYIYIKENS